jgi:TIR domain/Pentapeptide repeats (9 copies)
MANPEHQKILNRGVAAWNTWRKETPLVRPDLNGHILQHSLRFDMSSTRDLMDSVIGGAEERRECYEALKNGSIYRDSYWRDCWSIQDLRRINFENLDLTGAHLIFADLSEADLRNATLQQANLQHTVLKDANLTNANLEGAVLENTTFANTDLTRAKGLLSCRHIRPSPVDPATVHKSANLPQDFLLACGLSILDIRIAEISKPGLAVAQVAEIAENIRKLAEQPIQCTSCFISYSSEDTDFADRLYDDLRKKKIPCWFAPHHIRGGKKVYEQIEAAIRSDRVLLVLSEYSMKSEWVKTEIASARRREVLENRPVLFPIRLVSYEAIKKWESFDADIGRDSAKEVREYHIPDFSNWRNRVAYEEAFQRLLDDLSGAMGSSATSSTSAGSPITDNAS